MMSSYYEEDTQYLQTKAQQLNTILVVSLNETPMIKIYSINK